MARVKISEYRAKKILLGDTYEGIQLRSETQTSKSGARLKVPAGRWVAKVDQGVKKRFKQGLVTIDKSPAATEQAICEWEQKGFSQFILEPLFPHEASEEQYFSLERVRGGIRMLHTKDGGVDIEAHPEVVQQYVIALPDDVEAIAQKSGFPKDFLAQTLDVFEANFFAFLEINPLVVREGVPHILDAAVLVDSAGGFFTKAWADDIVKARVKHEAEERIESIAATTAASLKLTVMNPDGALFFLLSGGGGSIVIADEAQIEGVGRLMGNYGEYSGGPTREETYLYAKEVVALMLGSKSSKKALVIAGGVANFTDVKKTFLGIIDALRERAEELRRAQVRVFVRRGGPNEAAGLDLMRSFLEAEGILGSIHGSGAIITKAIDEAIGFVRS